MGTDIHPTAIVGQGAELGADVVIGAYSVIGADVRLGDRCQISAHAVVDGYTTLGADCKVFPFASVGGAPQDLKYAGEPSTLEMGMGNVVRECATLHRGTAHGNMKTVIGDNNLFMAYSHIAHDCVVGSNNVFANSVALAGHVQVSHHVILGGLVAVHQFCRIGEYAMLGGGAMVHQDVPPYCIAQGDRCVLRGINRIGLQRAGYSEDEVADIKKLYRIFASGSHKFDAFLERVKERAEELIDKPYIKAFLEFVQVTERGTAPTSKQHS